jgi:hypothetical protein
MPDEPKLKQAIDAGLDYLATHQLKDGGFSSFSSPSIQPFQPVKTYRTNFVPSLILAAISASNGPAAQAIRELLAGYLIKQAGGGWSFNYWARASREYKNQPYPDDLDDTFCALSALCLHNPKLIDEAVLTQAIKVLLAAETRVGGPYRTWLAPGGSAKVWRDVDVAVNSNIAYFLSLVSSPLPNLVNFIDRAIVNKELVSPYYPSAYPLIYYMARGYSGRHQQRLINGARDLALPAAVALDLALVTSSLLRLGVTDQAPAIQNLLERQAPDGSWPAGAFCLDPAIEGQAYYSGAAALTTALVIEALELYRQIPDHHHQPVTRKISAAIEEARAGVLALAEAGCQNLEPTLRATTMDALRDLAASGNGAEITRLPAGFNRSLLKPLKTPPENFFDELGLANLYGWLAYTVYDDFYDGTGQINLLPTANVALRNSWRGFLGAMPGQPLFQTLLDETFDAIDGANAWELENCRFAVSGPNIKVQTLPDYGNLAKLAERSLGHSLAPLAILLTGGRRPDSPAFKHSRQALLHYLIVRQLNDDVHDWQSDLEQGHISYVVAWLLTDLGVRSGNRRISTLTARARRQFWHHALPDLCREMQNHVELSRRELAASGLFTENNVVSELLSRLEISIADAAKSQHEAVSFLKHYNKQSVV